jgi:hypothetical protein
MGMLLLGGRQRQYAQGMGATDGDGFVTSFPLSPTAGSIPTQPTVVLGWVGDGVTIGTTGDQLTVTNWTLNGQPGLVTVGQKLWRNTGTYAGTVLAQTRQDSGDGPGKRGLYTLDTTGSLPNNSQLQANIGARQYFCNTASGDNINYNGLSPYPGYRMNGTGENYQYGATGQGSADAAYGPFESYCPAYAKLRPFTTSATNVYNQSAVQIFLAEGQTFYEGRALFTGSLAGTAVLTVATGSVTSGFVEAGLFLNFTGMTGSPRILNQLTSSEPGGVRGGGGTYTITTTANNTGGDVSMYGTPTDALGTNGLDYISGESVAYPICWQSYNLSDPLNTALHGRAVYPNRPRIIPFDLPTTFTCSISGQTLTIDSGTIVGPPPLVSGTACGQYLTGSGIEPNTFLTTGSSLTWGLNVGYTKGPTFAASIGGTGTGFRSFATGRSDYPEFDASPTTNQPLQGQWVWRGVDFTGIYDSGNSFSPAGWNILVENCVGLNVSMGSGGTPSGTSTKQKSLSNIIYRHTSMGTCWSNRSGVGFSGFGSGYANNLYLEDCILFQGGWKPDLDGRQACRAVGTQVGTALTVSSVTAGSIQIGQLASYGTNNYVQSGSHPNWVMSQSISNSGNFLTYTSGGGAPNALTHNWYAAHGGFNVVGRRNMIIDGSASGVSGRGHLQCYHNVLIDNPLHFVGGNSSNSAPTFVAKFTADVASGVLTVSAINDALYNDAGIIYPSRSTLLKGANVPAASVSASSSSSVITISSTTVSGFAVGQIVYANGGEAGIFPLGTISSLGTAQAVMAPTIYPATQRPPTAVIAQWRLSCLRSRH